jgi:hypothetical protein
MTLELSPRKNPMSVALIASAPEAAIGAGEGVATTGADVGLAGAAAGGAPGVAAVAPGAVGAGCPYW